jgi:hypothetical protein
MVEYTRPTWQAIPAAIQRASGVAADLERQPIANSGLLPQLVSRITIDKTNIRIAVNRDKFEELLLGQATQITPSPFYGLPLEIDITSHLLRCGKQMLLLIDETDTQSEPDPRLIGEILRARRCFEALSSGKAPTIAAMAKVEGVSASYVSLKISLAFLAPDIVEAIIDGNQPVSLTLERLKKACPLPASWEEQRALLLA